MGDTATGDCKLVGRACALRCCKDGIAGGTRQKEPEVSRAGCRCDEPSLSNTRVVGHVARIGRARCRERVKYYRQVRLKACEGRRCTAQANFFLDRDQRCETTGKVLLFETT